MRLYHFLNAKYGIAALTDRRIKIATIMELNDPFEFLAVDLSDRPFRWALMQTKKQLSEKQGILCFSKTWRNPVLWGHYAQSHRGLCLGFDVPRDFFRRVEYVDERSAPPAEPDLDFIKRILFTKFSHWGYEQEYRAFVGLDEQEAGLYFMAFSKHLKLRQVIVGDESPLSRADVSAALGKLQRRVEVFKARPAFRSFEVVRNKAEALWA